jgi:hypothetical protein
MNARSVIIALTSLIALFGVDLVNAGENAGHQTTSPRAQTLEPPADAELDKLGMQKLAEMTAMVRHNEICHQVPDEWSAAYLVLLMKNPPAEEDVEAQERNTLALRNRIGKAKWCQLYSVEMQEVFLVVQLLMQRNSQ